MSGGLEVSSLRLKCFANTVEFMKIEALGGHLESLYQDLNEFPPAMHSQCIVFSGRNDIGPVLLSKLSSSSMTTLSHENYNPLNTELLRTFRPGDLNTETTFTSHSSRSCDRMLNLIYWIFF